MKASSAVDRRKVFVVHGRNAVSRDGMFDFLRSIGLHPIDWSEAVKLTGKGSPYIGEVLDAAFAAAQAIVVLMTPDEVAYLRPEYGKSDEPDLQPGPQARPNVLFEAGMALGRSPERTILVELGEVRPFSDVAGRHALRLNNSVEMRTQLAERLVTAECAVDMNGETWRTEGDLTPPLGPTPSLSPGLGAPLTTDVARDETIRIDAHYENRGKGKGSRLVLTNRSGVQLNDLRFELPPEAGTSFHVHAELPVAKLPPGQSVGFIAFRTMGPGADHFLIPITARTPTGEPVATEAFVSLVT